MKRPFSIIHLSDLHFGRIHPVTLEHLDQFMTERKDDIKLAILTGDMTQRAKTEEFLAAKEFMHSLNAPLFVVPGNHDVPLYNLFLRFFSPYKKFLRYLGPFAQNYYEDENVAVFGLWTVDNFTIQSGKLRAEDLEEIEEKFRNVSPEKIKIIACHHPLFSIRHPKIKKDLTRLMDLKPHFILWGHEHQSSISSVHENELYPIILASGTSVSSRIRIEANSFNYMTFTDEGFSIEIFHHFKSHHKFDVVEKKMYPDKKKGDFRPLF